MGVSVQFNASEWAQLFPEFATTVNGPQAGACFTEATLYCRNDGCGPVNDAAQQSMLLNLLTAHVAQLQYGSKLQATSGLVGAITDASEGSVSVSVKNDYPPGTVQWYQQTKYGARFWAATAPYRKFRVARGPSAAPVVGPYGGFLRR